MAEFLETYQFGIYLCFFLLPIVQEDVGILGAASACASGLANPFITFILVLLGLTTSAWVNILLEGPQITEAGPRNMLRIPRSLKLRIA